MLQCGEQAYHIRIPFTVTLRMEQRLRFVENRMLRRIFGAEREEVNRDRRRLYNEESYDLYSWGILKIQNM